MALRLRRGTDAERLVITPVEGELLYTTDTKTVYIGDGTTQGGNRVTALSNMIEDVTPQLGGNLDLNGKNITGIGNISIDGTLTIPQIVTDLLADDSTVVFDSASQSLAVTDMVLAGSVNKLNGTTNGTNITSNHDSTVSQLNLIRSKGTYSTPTTLADTDSIFEIDFIGHDGTQYTSGSKITSTITGAVSNGYVPGALEFHIADQQILDLKPSGTPGVGGTIILRGATALVSAFDTANAYSFNFTKSRGDIDTPTTIEDGDKIGTIGWRGHDGSTHLVAAEIDAWASSIGSSNIQGLMKFNISDTSSTLVTAMQIDTNKLVTMYGGLTVAGSNVVLDGINILGNAISANDSNADLELAGGGTGTVSTAHLKTTSYFQSAVYADDTARDTAVASPAAGMIVFNSTGTKFQGYTGAAWVDLN